MTADVATRSGTRSSAAARGRRGAAVLVVALALALLGSWLAPVAGLVPVTPALAAATDLTLVTDTTYTVQPAEGRVRVNMTIAVRNNTRETRTKRYFFDHAFLAVLPGASDVRVSGGGSKVRVAKRSSESTLLRIGFGSRLYSGKSRTLKLSFNLVDPGKPAARALRVGPTLVTLPVWAHASTGAKGSTVRVRLPAGYDVFVESGSFDRRTTLDDGGTELATGKLAKPLQFFAYVSAQKPAVFVDTPLTVGSGDEAVALTLRGWKDDPAWVTRIGGLFERSLPALREEIGQPWPHDEPMVVQEAVSRAAGGYAGVFDPAENRIEVAYWADHLIVIHEAAHGWFNGALLADRWANEGFASLYAGRVAATLEETGTSPQLTEELAESAFPLNAWAAQPEPEEPAAGDPEGAAPQPAGPDGAPAAGASTAEAYGFAASLALAEAIAERAGDDALRAVWGDAAAGIGAYQPEGGTSGDTQDAAGAGPATPETVEAPPDWRGLLDLLEARTGKDFTDLWREWVVRPEEAALLDARAEARRSYARTVALAGDWALPRSIRDALRAWQFDAAEQLLADARTVLAQRGAVTDMAARDGLVLPDVMRTTFEAGDLRASSVQAQAERNAMLAIGQAAQARSADADVLTTIGMVGEDPEADLTAARTALATGDLDLTLASADDAYRAWSGAWQEGRRRALLAVAALATIVVLLSAVLGRVRSARRAPVAADDPAPPPVPST